MHRRANNFSIVIANFDQLPGGLMMFWLLYCVLDLKCRLGPAYMHIYRCLILPVFTCSVPITKKTLMPPNSEIDWRSCRNPYFHGVNRGKNLPSYLAFWCENDRAMTPSPIKSWCSVKITGKKWVQKGQKLGTSLAHIERESRALGELVEWLHLVLRVGLKIEYHGRKNSVLSPNDFSRELN